MKHHLGKIGILVIGSILLVAPQGSASPQESARGRLSPDRGFLGFSMALENLVDESQGIRVVRRVPGSPAEQAGLEVGDLILAIDSHPIQFADSLAMIRGLDRYKSGQRLKLTLRRGDSILNKQLLASNTSEADLARLEAWLASVENQREDAADPNLGCASPSPHSPPHSQPHSQPDRSGDSERRWRDLIRLVALKGNEAELTVVRQTAGEDPTVLFVLPELQRSGFKFADLPEDLRAFLVQLRLGDSVRYRIATGQNNIVIDSLTPYPDYINRPDAVRTHLNP